MSEDTGVVKRGDWSLDLEDISYEQDRALLLQDALKGINQTGEGHFVNLVTPGGCGEPEEWLIPELQKLVEQHRVHVKRFKFIDQCGCGGYVTRVYR